MASTGPLTLGSKSLGFSYTPLLANVDAQLAVAAAIRKQFDTSGMDATERYALYREHARSFGRADELQVCDQLARIKETKPELYTALCDTIRAASGSQLS